MIDKDIIIMEDFNIPKLDVPVFQAITSKGLTIPDVLRAREHGSNLKGNARYDQILHYRRHTKTFTDVGGVLDFLKMTGSLSSRRLHIPEWTRRSSPTKCPTTCRYGCNWTPGPTTKSWTRS